MNLFKSKFQLANYQQILQVHYISLDIFFFKAINPESSIHDLPFPHYQWTVYIWSLVYVHKHCTSWSSSFNRNHTLTSSSVSMPETKMIWKYRRLCYRIFSYYFNLFFKPYAYRKSAIHWLLCPTFLIAVQSSIISTSFNMYTMYGPRIEWNYTHFVYIC
jgi:hypothetical protein